MFIIKTRNIDKPHYDGFTYYIVLHKKNKGEKLAIKSVYLSLTAFVQKHIYHFWTINEQQI